MDIGLLLPFIILIGAMLLMTRSAKKKQQQAMQMRDRMEPGTGIRTIGGMYALVKEVHSDTVLLEVAPGVHAIYAKNAVGAVLEADEYERIVNGEDHDADAPVVPDDASSLVSEGGVDKTDLSKTDSSADDAETGDAKRKGDDDSK
ncbi:preprotein translocase subunit YajC [Streptomyces sp. SS8]